MKRKSDTHKEPFQRTTDFYTQAEKAIRDIRFYIKMYDDDDISTQGLFIEIRDIADTFLASKKARG